MANILQEYLNSINTSSIIKYITPTRLSDYFDKTSEKDTNNKFFNDPLKIICSIVAVLIFYFYFANNLVCHVIGLFYPSYLLLDNSQNMMQLMDFRKYFIIYSHLEFIFMITGLVGLHFYHLKVLILLALVYILQYRPTMLKSVYLKLFYYDTIIYLTMKNIYKYIAQEIMSADQKICKKID